MSKIEVSRRIAAPRERVWEVFTDLGSAAERIQGIESLEILSEGPVGEGTRWRETRKMLGKEGTEEMWITSFDPPASYEVAAESHGCKYHSVFTFVEDGAGTVASWSFGAEPQTFVAKLMSALTGWMLAGTMRKMLDADMADLQKACESDA